MAPSSTDFFPFALPHVEPTQKRIRVLFGGEYIVDTTNAKLVWTHPYFPFYFFKSEDVPEKYLVPAAPSDQENQQRRYDLVVGEKKAELAVTKYLAGELAGLTSILFAAADAWFEEDEQTFLHPKDPYKRVDVFSSSRHIRVEFNGQEVANTKRPRLLFETGLRVRTYIPKADCRMDLLEPTELTTSCPYKGTANYYTIRLPDGTTCENSVWWYRTPLPEAVETKGLVAFYDEKLDVYVDGVLQPR
ncbi:DUF427-domain-containing protein [Trametopsis cervina]|nr:DUF427-domain-containing protein [Trametopsis cervina]